MAKLRTIPVIRSLVASLTVEIQHIHDKSAQNDDEIDHDKDSYEASGTFYHDRNLVCSQSPLRHIIAKFYSFVNLIILFVFVLTIEL